MSITRTHGRSPYVLLDRASASLCRPRHWALLVAVALAIGVAHALSVLPLPLILGTGSFWEFPRGTVPGGGSDMAQVLIGYDSLVLGPWRWPVLWVPTLYPPAGTNVFWLDPVPLVGLAGKAVFWATGHFVNLLGAWLFACFVLPGVAMTGVLWMAGQRGLIAAVAGAALTDAMPFFMFEWGHVPLLSQFLLILGLFLYAARQRHPDARWVACCWPALLAVTVLTNAYLFAMVGGLWAAALVQRGLDRRAPPRRLLAEAAVSIAVVVVVLLACGVLSSGLGRAGTYGYGVFSMNLASPYLPQFSGAIPPLAGYLVGMRSQVFDYVGVGGLIVLLFGAIAAIPLLRREARAHAALIVLCVAWYLFALSHRVTLGSHLLVQVPLPDALVHALGSFRASGRFFWPVGYAAIAAGVVLMLRRFRPRTAVAVLLLAAALQVVDAGPQRDAIAATASGPAPPALDRARAAAVVARSSGVLVFPTFGCEDTEVGDDGQLTPENARLVQAIMEIQVLAARANLPINSAYLSREGPSCAAQRQPLRDKLVPGQAYFYLTPFTPSPAQLDGADPASVCSMLDWLKYCLLPVAKAG
jgi:hypothetical protein